MNDCVDNKNNRKKIALALQGGAAYGAFTWGVLDRLLQDERIEIVAVSGTSAGGLNAVALAYGLDMGGRDKAREVLKKVWNSLTYDEAIQNMPVIGKTSSNLNKALRRAFENIKKYDKNGKLKAVQSATQGTMMGFLNRKAGLFEEVLEDSIDFKELQKNKSGIPVFVSVTDVNVHSARIFTRDDISAKSVKASCAIPVVIGGVEIDSNIYWDGGFMDNPHIEALKDCNTDDILIVQTIPFLMRESSDKPNSTADRVLEFRANASIRKDLEYIEKDNERFLKNPKAAKKLGIKKINTHLINANKELKASHMLAFDRLHIDELYELGVKAADEWIKANFDKIGKESSFKITDKSSKPHLKKGHISKPKK